MGTVCTLISISAFLQYMSICFLSVCRLLACWLPRICLPLPCLFLPTFCLSAVAYNLYLLDVGQGMMTNRCWPVSFALVFLATGYLPAVFLSPFLACLPIPCLSLVCLLFVCLSLPNACLPIVCLLIACLPIACLPPAAVPGLAPGPIHELKRTLKRRLSIFSGLTSKTLFSGTFKLPGGYTKTDIFSPDSKKDPKAAQIWSGSGILLQILRKSHLV
jgi:hypothetical protein